MGPEGLSSFIVFLVAMFRLYRNEERSLSLGDHGAPCAALDTGLQGMAFGAIAYGLSPNQLNKHAALAARCTGIGRAAGRCATTAIYLGPDKHPTVRYRKELISNWAAIWRKLGNYRKKVYWQWPRLVEALRVPQTRWRKVNGPLSVFIASLLLDMN